MSGRLGFTVLGAAALCLIVGLAGLYAYADMYGINALLRRGGSSWVSVGEDDARLSASMRLALRGDPPPVTAGALV